MLYLYALLTFLHRLQRTMMQWRPSCHVCLNDSGPKVLRTHGMSINNSELRPFTMLHAGIGVLQRFQICAQTVLSYYYEALV